MNKEEKKRMLKEYALKQQQIFYDSLPMAHEMFEELFDYLDLQSETKECQHNFDVTTEFLRKFNCNIAEVIQWLNKNGAGCDCEVLYNIEENLNKKSID